MFNKISKYEADMEDSTIYEKDEITNSDKNNQYLI